MVSVFKGFVMGNRLLLLSLMFIFLFQLESFGDESFSDKIIKFGTVDSPGEPIYEKANAILTEAFFRNGYSFELLPSLAKRSLLMIENGRLDGDAFRIHKLNKNKEYKNIVRVEESIITIDQSVWSIINIAVNGWESLQDYKLVYERGHKFIENNLHYFKYAKPVDSLKQAFTMINLGRADIAITSKDTGTLRLKEYGLENSGIEVQYPPLLEFSLYTYMNIKHKDLAKKISTTLQEMKEDGTMDRIIDEVMSDFEAQEVTQGN